MERGAAAHTALRHGRVLFYLTPGAAPAGSAAVEGGAEGPYPPTPPCSLPRREGGRTSEGGRCWGRARGRSAPYTNPFDHDLSNRVNEFVL